MVPVYEGCQSSEYAISITTLQTVAEFSYSPETLLAKLYPHNLQTSRRLWCIAIPQLGEAE